jgi:response regulator NasT
MTSSLRIAVADDEPDMRDYYTRILPRLGHRVVVVAATGEQLVEQCRIALPDLVITDIKMPDLSGTEAAARLCEQRPLPVILVSAYIDSELIGATGSGHAQAYLVKPIKQSDLEPTIKLAMLRFAQQQEAGVT